MKVETSWDPEKSSSNNSQCISRKPKEKTIVTQIVKEIWGEKEKKREETETICCCVLEMLLTTLH